MKVSQNGQVYLLEGPIEVTISKVELIKGILEYCNCPKAKPIQWEEFENRAKRNVRKFAKR